MKATDMVDAILDNKVQTLQIAEGCVDVILDEMDGIEQECDELEECDDDLREADWGQKAYNMAKAYLDKRRAKKAKKGGPDIKKKLTLKGGALDSVSKRNNKLAAAASLSDSAGEMYDLEQLISE